MVPPRTATCAGYKALLATGWGGLTVDPNLAWDDLLVCRSVHHPTVLPRCHAAIHHADVGTVHATTRAGTVSVPVPFLADQPFWAALLHRRGLAPASVPARRLTLERLSAALAAVPHHRAANASIARSMTTEDGPAAALRLLTALT